MIKKQKQLFNLDMECCIHHEGTSDTKLVELSSVDSWNKLLAAAEIRKSAEI